MSMQKLVLGLFGGLHWWHYVQMIFTCIAAAVFLSLKLIIDNALRLPLGILITACAVHGIAHLLHLSMQDLTSYGMMLEGLSPEPWSATWSLMAAGISSVDWTVFVSRQWIALFVPYTLLHVILWVFYVSGFEDVADLGKGKKSQSQCRDTVNRRSKHLGGTFLRSADLPQLQIVLCHEK